MTSPSIHNPHKWLPYANFALILAFWGTLFFQLAYEWSHNEQYSYGLFVPFLGIYLLHLRWEDRPMPIPRKNILTGTLLGILVALAVLSVFPTKIIYEANADWRLNLWAQAMVAFSVTLLLLYRWGGWPWVRHFGFPFVFLLTAVPWPRFLEKELVLQLMGFVSIATVETVNLLGIYAQQSGNIIQLKNEFVTVEEACSGVRSFQSTIMGAIFLGELLRFSWMWRGIVLLLGGMCAIFFNFCRTLTLTLITAEYGGKAMERWHDSAGYMVFFFSMGTLGLICMLVRWKLTGQRHEKNSTVRPSLQEPAWLPMRGIATAIILIILVQPASEAWYALRGPESDPLEWSVDWYADTYDLQFEDIDPRIQDMLFFSEGELVRWTTPNHYNWIAYFFEWDTGRSAQLGGVHNPEICLPAVGWKMERQYDDFIWQGPDGLELILNNYFFINEYTEAYVFYTQWDPQGYPYHTKDGRLRTDRLRDVWVGDRKVGKQLLEVIIFGPESMEEARKAMIKFLNESIQVSASAQTASL